MLYSALIIGTELITLMLEKQVPLTGVSTKNHQPGRWRTRQGTTLYGFT